MTDPWSGDDLGSAYAAAHDVALGFTGPDEVFPAAYRVTELAAQAAAAATAAVAALDRARTGRDQAVTVDRVQLATAFRSERHLLLAGSAPPSPWGPIAGTYRTADGGWLQIHANFPHHEAGALAVLGVGEADRDQVATAVSRRERRPSRLPPARATTAPPSSFGPATNVRATCDVPWLG